ncbi:hypothetical protein F442_16412 [Phytophthora nicotianae P10297]|uniref:Uncharacterized protein n=5 Tax=Phytophthora nicotianae TaxID=4792 RepID=W2PS45_PHYN3|nr:hypothetical protein PPTG_15782 [Phytophthora nicotianae INRA-310]ETI37432.1 hypothetical protein F443_16569 [Phytophthora nicotianae P1569]ETL31098.1 hypothetical protein L916_15996 [Phytophthora nicotianae]ETO66209.1 hypothetical protein F444_16546 [Phytophthora nicotianae P1976]ETP35364.1 hypothetical protein F442_16412 [Phytophthora nicotianae P10297]ETL84352.1 hypothetical protein L917_15794 [Phytophthora nicotianae]
MIRGAARGLFQSARQVRRAAAKQNLKQRRVQATGGRPGDTRRTVCDLAREESIITNQQKQAFGRTRYVEAMPRILSVGAVGMLDVGAIDALNVLLQDLAEDDDDGR